VLTSERLCRQVIQGVLSDLNPEKRVIQTLRKMKFTKRLHLLAIGKAAWNMAHAAYHVLADQIIDGVVITKYAHNKGPIGNLFLMEAGHPIPGENSLKAGHEVLKRFTNLTCDDEMILLISGGGSALFEVLYDELTLKDLQSITQKLMASGLDIKAINAVRKRLSLVKGGQLAQIIAPASIQALIISDVIGDGVPDIASGPVSCEQSTPDLSAIIAALEPLDQRIRKAIARKLPDNTPNAQIEIIDHVAHACRSAKDHFQKLGINATIMTTRLECEAKEAGRLIASMMADCYHGDSDFSPPHLFIFGGETLVNVKGTGKGGRNQELALSAAIALDGLEHDCTLFSLGTDGTDGPTDAAGGIVNPHTVSKMKAANINPLKKLQNNDAYPALKAANALLTTGPTGTNVNDLICALMLE